VRLTWCLQAATESRRIAQLSGQLSGEHLLGLCGAISLPLPHQVSHTVFGLQAGAIGELQSGLLGNWPEQ